MVNDRPRPRCRYLMLRLGNRFCKEVWRHDIMAEPKPVDLGCPRDCPEYAASFPTVWETEKETEG